MSDDFQLGLGRPHAPDERDQSYPMAAALPEREPRSTYRYWWPLGWWGYQGNYPHCVGYAWTHWAEDGPVTHDAPPPLIDPDEVYHEAQQVDEWPGDNYDGTSVRAGAKVLQGKNLIESYLWAQNVDDVIKALLMAGPVVVGTTWFDTMSKPDEKTFLIEPKGRAVGGHAYLLNGVNTKRGLFRMKNSWGQWWGKNGHAYIRIDDFAALLDDYGEACLAVEKETR